MPALSRFHSLLTARTDARVVGIVRIAVGISSVIRAVEGTRILSEVFADGRLRMPYVPWAVPPPSEFVPVYGGIWVLVALAFTAGVRTRVAGSILSALMFYTLLLDQQAYSNHLYLLSILVLLLTVADAGRAFAIDSRHLGGPSMVQAWPVWVLKCQLTIVYVFSALSKLNIAFLSGLVIYVNWRTTGWLAVPEPLRTIPIAGMLGLATIILELWVAFALWSRRFRVSAAIVGVGLHASMILLLSEGTVQLAVFALEVLALYLLFFDDLWAQPVANVETAPHQPALPT